jgi:uncharacterized protein with PIN domain
VDPNADPRFACDAMLGGLARWLRAAGYDASWHDGIADPDLVRLGHNEGRTLLSSDTDVFQFALVRDGVVPAVFVPRHLSPPGQLAHVLDQLRLPLRQPRCMACGGDLAELPRERAEGRAPPGALARHDRFWECGRCGKVFWRGSHWGPIQDRLRQAAPVRPGDPAPAP